MKSQGIKSWTALRKTFMLLTVLAVGFMLNACDNKSTTGPGDEESGTQYSKTDIAVETLNGATLTMSYDAASNSFTGVVDNNTKGTLKNVRVEIHLSNGKELGPTTPKDLAVGESMTVTLHANSSNWTTWSVHPEAG